MMDTASAARAVSGRIVGDSVRFARVTTDTRALQAGDLFVALRGERFDGHDFVATAFQRGAAAALVAADRADDLAGNLVVATDPQAALGALAAHWRRAVHDSGHRHRRQQRQDDREGNARGDPARAFRRRCRARDAGQSQQLDRPSADAAAPAHRASRRGDRARHESSRRDGRAGSDRAADRCAGQQRAARASGVHEHGGGGRCRTCRPRARPAGTRYRGAQRG